MKLIKLAGLIFIILLLSGCSNGASGDAKYEEMVNTIKEIEISENKLVTLNTTFDEYKKAFEGKFITEDLEKHFIGEDQGASFPYGLVLKGDIDQEFLEDPMGHIEEKREVGLVDGAIMQKLTQIDFSKAYLNDAKDTATIYAKKLYEYYQNEHFADIKGLDITKSNVLVEKYIFKKMENQWKIMSSDEKLLEYIRKNEETGEDEFVAWDTITHQNEEIEYIKTIEVEDIES